MTYKKYLDKFLVGLKVFRSWVDAPTIFKITPGETVFSKMGSTFTILEGIFEAKFRS